MSSVGNTYRPNGVPISSVCDLQSAANQTITSNDWSWPRREGNLVNIVFPEIKFKVNTYLYLTQYNILKKNVEQIIL